MGTYHLEAYTKKLYELVVKYMANFYNYVNETQKQEVQKHEGEKNDNRTTRSKTNP